MLGLGSTPDATDEVSVGGSAETEAERASYSDSRHFDLVNLALSRLPLATLLERLPEQLAETLNCNFCGIAVRANESGEASLRVTCRDQAGAWGDWQTISKPGENGGAVTARVLAESTWMVCDDWNKSPVRDPNLEQLGVANGLVVPIGRSEAVLGTLGIYHNAPRRYRAEDLRYIDMAASLLAQAFEQDSFARQLAAATLIQRREREATGAAVAVLSRDYHLLEINRALESIGGFTLPELHDRTFITAFSLSKECSHITKLLSELTPEGPPLSMECGLLSKQGVIRRIAWTFCAMTLPTNEIKLLAMGIDITERAEAIGKARRAEAKAKAYLDSLLSLQSAIEAGDIVLIRRKMSEAVKLTRKETEPEEPKVVENGRDKRAHVRRKVLSTQFVAPYTNGQRPDKSKFFAVLCNDLSAGGISFFLPQPPAEKEFAIVLGTPSQAILMRAEVCNTRPVEQDGEPKFLVGCKFIERIQLA